ncbi:kazal-type serine protease inhibitor domain-containing protein 1-like [Pristis pectinata]|uniref:kazal-type serine protease inhibitor domain-containing protein 1-like n=1 Tax=Pristis pectinata TaxID=685728 RepID=UPI00223C9613|nr:kazal-type serine protease inhibitor domain-containing protein 1-like [Pristis pectinata]XP_051883479.1 kazal-type serine protease inhibitor domain-containing protein 1-like [Pristis pectinata]
MKSALSALISLILLLVISGTPLGSQGIAVGSVGDVPPGWRTLLDEGTGCPGCDVGLCAPPRGCLAGIVRDPCGCCWECANIEGQLCDLDNTNHFYGQCGENLECRLELSGLREGEIPEPQCVCCSSRAVCGSNGQTYPHICRFQEAASANQTANLTLAHQGPCEAVPQIISPPFSVWNTTGEDVIFGCEIFAYPMAAIEWRKEGLETFLPGDDPHISVQFRGGPLKYEVTGWLQIQGIHSSDSGTYHCCARNKLGEVSAAASLTVISPDQLGEADTRWRQAQAVADDYSDPDDYY